uniref:transcription repressor OFP13 n=1 Tax=Fragaria vesca subsp. vesca TaxID=101020 RepID=UPI0005CB7D3D|nr:PREDICTED: transcription repressor OFP13 [Fragaria vesca subsp. vesca]
MKLLPSSLFKNTAPAPEPKSSSSSWPWPSCTQTRTISFRIPGNDMFKTINSAYFDTNTPESFFTNSSEGCASFSTTVSEEDSSGGGGDPIETVINKGLRSERLFFDPGETSSILDKDSIKAREEEEEEEEDDDGVDDELAGGDDNIPFKESVALSMDSPDPYVDFRKSMEEMVEAHGLKDWEHLEELLCWYLRVNGKSNHGYIVGAFVDLLVGLAFSTSIPPPSCSCSEYSPSTPLSFYTSTTSCSSSSTSTPCVSSIGPEDGSEMSTSTIPYLSSLLEAEEEINEEDDDDDDGASS